MYADQTPRFAEFLLVILVLALLCPAAAASETLEFAHQTLSPQGAPDLEFFDDYNGDGEMDILFIDNRTLSLFLNQSGAFPEEPSRLFQAPEDAVFIDAGHVGPAAVKVPLFLSRTGVYRLPHEDEEKDTPPIMVLAHENPFIPARVKKLAFVDFLRDLTGDGVEDLVIPELERFVIYEAKGDGAFEVWGEIPYNPRSDFYTESLSQTGRWKEVVHVPRLFSGRQRGCNFLVLYDGSWISLIKQCKDRSFELEARLNLYMADNRQYEESSRAYFGKNVFFEDLNEDGAHALIIVDNHQGTVNFHQGSGNAKPFEKELTLRTEGWVLKPEFLDLNQDGLRDMILPSIEKIGFFTIMRIFFTSRFDINYMVFLNRREPLFPLQPDISRTVSLPLSFTAGPEGINIKHSLIYTFAGDFNKDGIHDFLCRSTPRELGIFHGKKGGVYSEEPDMRIFYSPLPRCSSSATRVMDLNKDGVSDLFLHQKSIENEVDTYDLYLSGP